MKLTRFAMLIRLEIKRTLKLMPKMIISAIILLALVAGITIGANGLLSEGVELETESKITIGVVCLEQSRLMDYAKRIIDSTESINSVVDLRFVDEDEANYMLKNGEAMAVVVIPDNVISDIMKGKNTPMEVKFPDNAGYEAAMFKEIAETAVNMLSTAQAAIYSVYDFYEENFEDDNIDDALDRLNAKYIKTVLFRESLFDNTTVVVTGELSVVEYYVISGVVIFMFLLGMNVVSLISSYKKEVLIFLRQNGVGELKQIIARIISMSLIYLLIGLIIMILMVVFGVCELGVVLRILCTILPASILVSSVVLCVYVWLQNKSSTVIVLFLFTIIQGFVTGAFVPEVMLPDAVSSASRFVPAKYIIEMFKGAYQNNLSLMMVNLLIVLVISIIVIVCTVFGYKLMARKVANS